MSLSTVSFANYPVYVTAVAVSELFMNEAAVLAAPEIPAPMSLFTKESTAPPATAPAVLNWLASSAFVSYTPSATPVNTS